MSSVVYLRARPHQTVLPAEARVKEPLLFQKIRGRNKLKGQHALVLVSGDPGEGKSRFAGWMIESLDPTFIESWRNGTPRISISPVPLIQALKADLLPPRSWWFIDEPRDVKNVAWQEEVCQALRDVLTEYRFKVVNLVVCTTMRKKLLNDLRDLANFWVRMTSPGRAEVRKMETGVRWVHGELVEVKKARLLERLRHAPMPSADFESLYAPLKAGNFQDLTDMWIKRFVKRGYIK